MPLYYKTRRKHIRVTLQGFYLRVIVIENPLNLEKTISSPCSICIVINLWLMHSAHCLMIKVSQYKFRNCSMWLFLHFFDVKIFKNYKFRMPHAPLQFFVVLIQTCLVKSQILFSKLFHTVFFIFSSVMVHLCRMQNQVFVSCLLHNKWQNRRQKLFFRFPI